MLQAFEGPSLKTAISNAGDPSRQQCFCIGIIIIVDFHFRVAGGDGGEPDQVKNLCLSNETPLDPSKRGQASFDLTDFTGGMLRGPAVICNKVGPLWSTFDF